MESNLLGNFAREVNVGTTGALARLHLDATDAWLNLVDGDPHRSFVDLSGKGVGNAVFAGQGSVKAERLTGCIENLVDRTFVPALDRVLAPWGTELMPAFLGRVTSARETKRSPERN